MILTEKDTGVETPLQGERMAIEENSVLFNILSDRMYKNKIRAVIREISTNAVDAQIEAGNPDTPIKVTLPTILEPTFKVRDFGTGLAPEDIMSLYTYGASTKRHTNLLNGALGLGSKSPFAYAKAFTTTSFWNGRKYTYSVYSDNGSPTVALLGETETDEPNGLEVSVPVMDKDVYDFEREAKFVYRFFSTDIDCNIDLGVKLKDQKPSYGKDNWGVYPVVGFDSYIVMANVAYSLSSLGIPDTTSLQTQGLVVFVDTGDVEFAASREELSLTEGTIAYLKNLAKKISKDIDTILDEATADADTVADLMKVVSTLPNELKYQLRSKLPELNISYGGKVSAKVPSDFVAKTTPSWTNRLERIGTIHSDWLTRDDYLFVFTDVKNRMSFIKETETKKVIFIDSRETKTKENAKSRFDSFIKKFGLKKTQYKYATDYTLPKRERGVVKTAGIKYAPIRQIYKFAWDKERGKFVHKGTLDNTATTVEDCIKNPNMEVFSVVVSRNVYYLKDCETEISNYGTPIHNVFSVLGGHILDKDKEYVFVAQTITDYKKGNYNIQKFWTDLIPKKLTVWDVEHTVSYLKKLGFPLTYLKESGKWVFDSVRNEKDFLKYLPKDLNRLINKLYKTDSILLKSWSDVSDFKNISRYCGIIHGEEYKMKHIKLGKIEEKYSLLEITSVGWARSNELSKARLVKAWDMSYNKLKKLDEQAYKDVIIHLYLE